MKKWQIILPNIKHRTHNIDEIIKALLANRGLKTNKQIDEFLSPPKPSNLTPKPLGIKTDQLEKAINRIKQAITEKESVVVYGDYDADGVCGTAILWEALNKLGARVMPYIPHRVEEGYGLSQKGIDAVKKEYDATLIITVDHGIGADEKVGYSKKLGIDIIVTDHHVAPKKLPDAQAIVHTTELSGAGVAWFLAKEICSMFHIPCSMFLDLVAIATIADMVPLTGANRILVKYGLEELNHTQRLGLQALIKEAGLAKGKVGVYEVSHILAPKLNAMGRLEHAIDSLRLLCTRNADRARELARHLNQINKERQRLMEETTLHAENLLTGQTAVSQINEKLIFLSHESYNQGIIGLVAGKLVEKYYRPAIVVSRGEEFSKASARSINGFNIIETIRKAENLLVDCGGHPMAAGFTVETKNLAVLQKRLTEIAEKELDKDKLTRVLKIDCELDLNDLNFELYQELEPFKPYGLGNPEPVFASRNVMVKDVRIVGADGKHLKLQIANSLQSTVYGAVAFGLADLFPKLSPDKPVDIAYTLSIDEWNGNKQSFSSNKRLELKIKDIKIE